MQGFAESVVLIHRPETSFPEREVVEIERFVGCKGDVVETGVEKRIWGLGEGVLEGCCGVRGEVAAEVLLSALRAFLAC